MKRIVALSVLMLGAALAGPRQNNIVIGTSQEPANIQDPWATNNMAIASEINALVGAPLVWKNNEGKVIAELATRVPTVQNGDIKINREGNKVTSNSVTYRIRPNAKWSDGTPITVEDFQFWLEVQNDPRVPVPVRDPFDRATIKKIDDKAFTITYGKGGYLFADQAGPGYAPAHVMRKDWEAFKEATAKLDPKTQAKEINDRFQQMFLGKHTSANGLPKVSSGAFKLTDWRPGASMTFERNANYFRKPTGDVNNYAKQVIYRFIPDTNTLRVNVMSGQLDALARVGVSFDQGLELEKAQGNRYKTVFVPGSIWEHIDLNKCNGVQKVKDLNLDDKRVRQALLHAMNREDLVKTLYEGKQPVSHSFVSTLSPLYKKDIQKYEYSPEKAKQLLAAAGWKPGPDGILTKDGKKFEINFTTTAGNKIRERVQQVLIAQLRQVGVDAKVANQPSSVVFAEDFIQRASEGKWDSFMFAWVQDPAFEDGDLFADKLITGESNIPTAANGYAGQNIGCWSNAEYDKLYQQAATEFNLDARKKLFDRMQAIWADEVPALPLYNRADVVTVAPGLQNYTFSASSQYPTWNAYALGWEQNGAKPVNR